MPYNDPRDIPGLIVWYSACNETTYYADGDFMGTIHDLSGNGLDATNVASNSFRMKHTGGQDGGPFFDCFSGGRGVYIPDISAMVDGTNGVHTFMKANAYGNNRGPLQRFSTDQYMPFSDGNVYSDYFRTNRVGPINIAATPIINNWRDVEFFSATGRWFIRFDGAFISGPAGATFDETTLETANAILWGCFPNAGNPNGFRFGGLFMFDHELVGEELAFMQQWQETYPCGGEPYVPNPPGPPVSVTCGTSTTETIPVNWSTPVTGGTVTAYQVRLNGGTPISAGLNLTYTFTALTPDTTYTVEVNSVGPDGESAWVPITCTTEPIPAPIVPSACPCGPRWVIEATDLATGRIRAILRPIAADWQTILKGLGTGSLTFPTRGVSLRDIFPDLTGVFISHIADDGTYDCQYAGYVEKANGKSTLQGGTVQVGMQPIERYWWRRFLDTDRTYTGIEQTQIAASLTSYAITDGIPLLGVAEPSAILRDRTYIGAERPFIGNQLDDLAGADDGIEWTLVHTRTNGYWSTTVLFQDRAGTDLDTIFSADVDAAEYGIDIDAANHATYVDGFGVLPDGTTQVISNAQDTTGPYVRFDAAPSFGTVLDATNNQEQTTGYLIGNQDPSATPTFAIVGDDPDPTGVRLGDQATFRINQGAVRFNGPARIGSISSRIAEGAPWVRTLGLIPVGRVTDTVLN